jgi:hypothetical protein
LPGRRLGFGKRGAGRPMGRLPLPPPTPASFASPGAKVVF